MANSVMKNNIVDSDSVIMLGSFGIDKILAE